MSFTTYIPFVGDNGETEEVGGRVRLLGKIEDLGEFDPDDFIELVQDSLAEIDHLLENKTAALDDELRTSVSLEDLMERHLSYRIEVGKLKEEDDGAKRNIAEGTSLKVIMRVQPKKAIEINGPQDVSEPFREALQTSFSRLQNKNITFKDILSV